VGLVFLILAGGERSDGGAVWRRGRTVLRDVDRKLAAAPDATYLVRVVPGPGPCRKPRPAGRLSRHRLRPPAPGADFAGALGTVRTMIKQDLTALELSGRLAARPAVVFYAVDPPVADAVTAQEYAGLTADAAVTWVVPGPSAALLSPVFAGGGARVLADYHAVTAEIAADLVRGCVPA
jgi:hypothetical protein